MGHESHKSIEQIKKELEWLKTEGRKQVEERFLQAIKGDEVDNTLYNQAKDYQILIEGKILVNESVLKKLFPEKTSVNVL